MEKVIKAELIEEFLKKNNLSKAKFCKMCKISPSTLTRVMNSQNFKLTALFKIARAMGIFVYQLVK